MLNIEKLLEKEAFSIVKARKIYLDCTDCQNLIVLNHGRGQFVCRFVCKFCGFNVVFFSNQLSPSLPRFALWFSKSVKALFFARKCLNVSSVDSISSVFPATLAVAFTLIELPFRLWLSYSWFFSLLSHLIPRVLRLFRTNVLVSCPCFFLLLHTFLSLCPSIDVFIPYSLSFSLVLISPP